MFKQCQTNWHCFFEWGNDCRDEGLPRCLVTGFLSGKEVIPTWLDGTVDMRSGLVKNPIESGLHGKPRQHAVFRAVPITRRHVDSTALVMKRPRHVLFPVFPSFRHAKLYSGPLVHYRYRQSIELLLASLKHKTLLLSVLLLLKTLVTLILTEEYASWTVHVIFKLTGIVGKFISNICHF